MRVILDDITRIAADAIVNAANTSLMGGGGVDGAIHRAAGPRLLAETRLLGGCPIGEARLSQGYDLPARYVIHTVGPVWRGGGYGEPALLTSCYQSCMAIAQRENFASVAFSCISAGTYAYPTEAAARIAVTTVRNELARLEFACDIVFCCFTQPDFAAYTRELAAVPPETSPRLG